MGFFDFLKGLFGGKKAASQKVNCPSCGTEVTMGSEVCPECGVSISELFRRKCPNCGELNEVDSDKCSKCGHSFAEEEARELSYNCSSCGYQSDTFFAVCPVCGTRTT